MYQDCTTCHGADKLKPFPANHAGSATDSCQTCHQVAEAGAHTRKPASRRNLRSSRWPLSSRKPAHPRQRPLADADPGQSQLPITPLHPMAAGRATNRRHSGRRQQINRTPAPNAEPDRFVTSSRGGIALCIERAEAVPAILYRRLRGRLKPQATAARGPRPPPPPQRAMPVRRIPAASAPGTGISKPNGSGGQISTRLVRWSTQSTGSMV